MAKLTADNNLAAVNPDLAAQWHPSGNGDLKPEDVTHGSNRKVWWQCEQGHEWQAEVNRRSQGRRCAQCISVVDADKSLEAVHPELAKQFHPSKNQDLTPRQITHGSNRKVWWQA